MPAKKSKGLLAAASEATIEVVKQIVPFSGAFIEGVRKYHESIEEQQREEFVQALSERVEELSKNAEWYKSEQGQAFVKKIVATALNAEYVDKLEFLANALVNGPKLGADEAMRAKFVEMIRQLSKPALEVLVASLGRVSGTGQVMPGEIAGILRWSPELVDACVRELYAFGAFSSTTHWAKSGEGYRQGQYFNEGVPARTDFTKSFSEFISRK
jgi:hypothetical protein